MSPEAQELLRLARKFSELALLNGL